MVVLLARVVKLIRKVIVVESELLRWVVELGNFHELELVVDFVNKVENFLKSKIDHFLLQNRYQVRLKDRNFFLFLVVQRVL